MAHHGNDNLEAGNSVDIMDKKAWETPRMEKLDVSVHTQNNPLGLLSDGILGAPS